MQAETEDKFQAHVYHLRAIVQSHLGDREGAIVSLRQAIYCDPKFALAHYTMADLSAAQGDHKLAARHWRVALQTIRDLPAEQLLPFTEDLTVEMLQGLLTDRLNTTNSWIK